MLRESVWANFQKHWMLSLGQTQIHFLCHLVPLSDIWKILQKENEHFSEWQWIVNFEEKHYLLQYFWAISSDFIFSSWNYVCFLLVSWKCAACSQVLWTGQLPFMWLTQWSMFSMVLIFFFFNIKNIINTKSERSMIFPVPVRSHVTNLLGSAWNAKK